MANIFISYGDERFKMSLDRIARQARRVGIFDKIIKYTPKDLPLCVTSSPAFSFSRGAGVYIWKPYIIYKTLKECNEGDVVYYADAGCTLVKDSPEWELFKREIKKHSAIFFQYRNNFKYNGWEQYCEQPEYSPVACKHWMKPSLRDYFSQFIDTDFLDYEELWAGFMIFKKMRSMQHVLEQWLNITLYHPEYAPNPFGDELKRIPSDFYAHRQAQGMLTPLVFHYGKRDNVLVLPETAESRIGNPAVLATRWIQGKMSWWQMMKYLLWRLIHGEL